MKKFNLFLLVIGIFCFVNDFSFANAKELALTSSYPTCSVDFTYRSAKVRERSAGYGTVEVPVEVNLNCVQTQDVHVRVAVYVDGECRKTQVITIPAGKLSKSTEIFWNNWSDRDKTATFKVE